MSPVPLPFIQATGIVAGVFNVQPKVGTVSSWRDSSGWTKPCELLFCRPIKRRADRHDRAVRTESTNPPLKEVARISDFRTMAEVVNFENGKTRINFQNFVATHRRAS
jgi:hypothetical protein